MPKDTYTYIDTSYVTTQSNTTDQMSEILEVRAPAGQELHFDPGDPLEILMMTHESFTTNGTASDQETFALSNKLADSPLVDGGGGSDGEDTSPPSAGPSDLVLYEAGSRVTPDNVRYDDHTTTADRNEFDYTDDGTSNTLDVYYIFRDSFQLEGRTYVANEKSYDDPFTGTNSLHRTNVYNQNERYTWDNSFRIGTDEKLKFFIDTSVDLTNWNSNTSDKSEPTSGASSTSIFKIPTKVKPASGRDSRARNKGFGVNMSAGGRRGRF